MALTSLTAAPVRASRGGITGFSGKFGAICNTCHSGGAAAPTVSFEGPTQVEAGAVATFRFVVRSNSSAQTGAGFNVAAGEGQLIATDGDSRLATGELTHRAPKANVDGEASWTFSWQAPLSPGMKTLFGAGNSVNRNGFNDGDLAAATTLVIEVLPAPPSATPTETPTPTDSPTAEDTATATVTATATETLTEAPSPTPTLSPTPGPPSCPGDCNGDGEVTVDELVRGVNIALGSVAVSACPPFDLNGDAEVTVDELVRSVNAALIGCR